MALSSVASQGLGAATAMHAVLWQDFRSGSVDNSLLFQKKCKNSAVVGALKVSHTQISHATMNYRPHLSI